MAANEAAVYAARADVAAEWAATAAAMAAKWAAADYAAENAAYWAAEAADGIRKLENYARAARADELAADE